MRFVTRWDLDKTYLRTEFDTLGDLWRTALERPDQKRAVPGAAALLRALGETGARIHVLSGSPRQLRARVEEKLRIDGVRWDELTLKPNLSNMLRLRLRAVRDQLGYKLPVLLVSREEDQRRGEGEGGALEVLVGDDAEADAFVYSLYADLCEGTVGKSLLERVLTVGETYADQREACMTALGNIVPGPTVARILIHLDRQSPPSDFDLYGPRVVPFYNYLQAAFVLVEDGILDGRGPVAVASDLVEHRFDGEALARSYLDLHRRGHARGTAVPKVRAAVDAVRGHLDPITLGRLDEMCDLIDSYRIAPPTPRPHRPFELDYVKLATRHRRGKNRKQFRVISE